MSDPRSLKTNAATGSDLDQWLALLPDLDDAPLDEPWMRRAQTQRSDPPKRFTIGDPLPVQDAPGDEPDRDDETVGRKPRRGRRLIRATVVLLVLALVGFGGVLAYGKSQFDSIERVEIGGVAAPLNPGGTNYLIVGSDSRENLDPNVENAGAIFGDGTQDIGGQRTDTIQILRIADDGSQHILALPRDLYLPLGGTGNPNRINAAYSFGGAELLIQTIQGSLGIPIHHYAEVDFAGFIDMVDAVGGVTIDFPHPAYDLKTGLSVPEAGPTVLDSTQALAFVRSRAYTEVIDGQTVLDPRSDLGRVKRQQMFMQSLFSELGSPSNQLAVLGDLDTSTGSVRLDERLSYTNALKLAQDLRSLDLNDEWDLEVSHFTTSTGAQVLQLNAAASQPTLDFFKN